MGRLSYSKILDNTRLPYILNIYGMDNLIEVLSGLIGFDWDEGNARKGKKHGVNQLEAEQVFFNKPLLVLPDIKHSRKETRFHALGKTNEGRLLHVTFTMRFYGTKMRVISARNMHYKERRIYEQETKINS